MPGTPGRRISSDRVAAAPGDEPVVEGVMGDMRQCVEVLIRLESRWGAAWTAQTAEYPQPQGRGGGQQRAGQHQESDGGVFIIRNASVRGAAWSDQINHELIQQNFTDHYRTIL